MLMFLIGSVGFRSARGSPFGTLPGNSGPDRNEIYLDPVHGLLSLEVFDPVPDCDLCSLKFRARDAKKVACHASPGVVCTDLNASSVN